MTFLAPLRPSAYRHTNTANFVFLLHPNYIPFELIFKPLKAHFEPFAPLFRLLCTSFGSCALLYIQRIHHSYRRIITDSFVPLLHPHIRSLWAPLLVLWHSYIGCSPLLDKVKRSTQACILCVFLSTDFFPRFFVKEKTFLFFFSLEADLNLTTL